MKKEWVDTLRERVQDVKHRVEATAQRMADSRVPVRGPAPGASAADIGPGVAEEAGSGALAQGAHGGVPQVHEEPPVVARMIVEIRSDGTRTVARGALEDIVTGERVAIEANGGSPLQLAASLAQNLLSTPFAVGRAAGALVRGRFTRGGSQR